MHYNIVDRYQCSVAVEFFSFERNNDQCGNRIQIVDVSDFGCVAKCQHHILSFTKLENCEQFWF